MALFMMLSFASLQAQEKWSLNLSGGYENFPENPYNKDGYRLGGEVRCYLKSQLYALFDFYVGSNQGSKTLSYLDLNSEMQRGKLDWKRREYGIDWGFGWEFMQLYQHSLYVQGLLGVLICNEHRPKQDWNGNLLSEVEKDREVHTSIGLSLGYDYHLTDHWLVGVNYTGYLHWGGLDKVVSLWILDNSTYFQHTINARIGWVF